MFAAIEDVVGWTDANDVDGVADGKANADGEANNNDGNDGVLNSDAAHAGTLLISEMGGGWNLRLLLIGGAAIGGRNDILPTIDDGTTAVT